MPKIWVYERHEKEMNKKIWMIVGSLGLLGLFLFPLWSITLEAPQYPDGITLYIWINQITGSEPGTLQNINILNHYIGMKYITPESIPELQYFPYIVVGMALLGVIFGLTGNWKLTLTWMIILSILGALGVYDFYLWEYDYGHNLDPKAPIKIEGMAYQPPLIGSKYLLNFKAISWPSTGAISFLWAYTFGFISIMKTRKIEK
jgi:copper chaperone NosL